MLFFQIDQDFVKLFPDLPNGLDILKTVSTDLFPFFETKSIDPSAAGLLKHLNSASEGMCLTF